VIHTREILFRGKRLDNGEWEQGYYCFGKIHANANGGHFIAEDVDGEVWGVDPSTVGQSTGLKDKNGKMIFEGDIIKTTNTLDEEQTTGVISFSELFKAFLIGGNKSPLDIPSLYIYEILGNITDNPGLIP
jgi:uncharacterized phage protein (TIGR01671 family)